LFIVNRGKADIYRLEKEIELARVEMTKLLQLEGYNFQEKRVVSLSRKLDRLLNIYQLLNQRRDEKVESETE